MSALGATADADTGSHDALPPASIAPVAVAAGITAVLTGATAAGLVLTGSPALVIACAAILIFGLPHGALDIQVIGATGRAGGFGRILAVYAAIAAVTATVWAVAPIAALAGFIIVAIVHFVEDWDAAGSRFFAAGAAAATLAAPAVLHRDAVAAIFVALAGTDGAAQLADALLVIAPTALAVASLAIAAMIIDRRRAAAMAATTSLAAMILLPPAIGFAVFFCLIHSPRHFEEALKRTGRTQIRQWVPIVVPVTAAALAVVTVAYLYGVGRYGAGTAVPMRLAAATFMALSIVTVPHMLAPRVVRMLGPRESHRPADPREHKSI